jgi:hypothetical protein
MDIYIAYDKKRVLQALRYHFIKRPEIRVMMVLINVFAIFSAVLFSFKLVSPLAFLISSFLWIALMVSFWFILPYTVYRNAATFKDNFMLQFRETGVVLENEKGLMEWSWNRFSTFFETPHFIHLYFNSRSFFLVPKEAIDDPVYMDELRLLLTRKIKKK